MESFAAARSNSNYQRSPLYTGNKGNPPPIPHRDRLPRNDSHPQNRTDDYGKSPRSAQSSIADSATNALIREVAEKLEKMKSELQSKKEKAKELQGDLVRLEAAKDRREKKVSEKWETQLRKVDDEHARTCEDKNKLITPTKKQLEQLG